jgi:Na+(H+)/acetate symporter ActP
MISAYWKIPLQALVLLVGVFLFLFFLYTPAPMLFNPVHERVMRQGPHATEYRELESRFEAATASRSAAARVMSRAEAAGNTHDVDAARSEFQRQDAETRMVRSEAIDLVRRATGDAAYSDVNYVFPTFITQHMPIGLPGLLVAAILAAAMSAIGGELSSLSTATVIDFYRRFVRAEASDAHFLKVSRFATAFWGLFASIVAVWAAELGSLIEVVNRFGSFFYGSILGVFILAVGFPRATANGAFVGLVAGMAAVAWAASATNVAFLWHNVIGAVTVVIVGLAVSAVSGTRPTTRFTGSCPSATRTCQRC